MNPGPHKLPLARALSVALIAITSGACGGAGDPANDEVQASPAQSSRRSARTAAAKPDQFSFVTTAELSGQISRPAGERGFVLADARFRVEYEEQHIPGAVNARADLSAEALSKLHVDLGRHVIFYCNGPTCTKSKKAAAVARQAGYTNVSVYDEGLPAWLAAKLPVEGVPLPKFEAPGMTAAALDDLLKAEPTTFVVDIRPASEFNTFHIPSAHNIPLDDVAARKGEIPATGTIAIVDHAGHQRGIAARLFHVLGFQTIRTLEGGTLAWQQANLPLDKADNKVASP